MALAQSTTTTTSTTQDTTGQTSTTQSGTQSTGQTANEPAQTSTEQMSTTQSGSQPSGQTVDDPSQSTGPQGVTQQNTVPNGQATAPAGTDEGMTTGTTANQSASLSPRPATTEYPPCSRTVTDACIQTYEKGVRASRRRR
jgi:hypothetical protein